jgi:4-amino-4-deoxy-L-arabinose transferase-like glycosyltransferase
VAFLNFGRVAMSDTLLTLWSVLAVALWARAYRAPAPAWILPALGLVLGLGFQTKGPVALLIPGLGMLLLSWQKRDTSLPLTRFGVLGAALLFGAIGLGWFGAVYWRLGAEPLRWFFLSENLERFAGRRYDAGQPSWFYLVTYLAEGFPWSVFLPLAVAEALRGRDDSAAGARWLLCWVGAVMVPLTLSRGKLDYYLLPLYPPLSLVLGRYFASATWQRRDRYGARAALVLIGGLALLAVVLPLRLPAAWLPPSAFLVVFSGVAVAAVLLCAWRIRNPEPARVVAAVAGATAMLFLGASTLLLPGFLHQQPNPAIVRDIAGERTLRPDAEVVLCEDPTRVQRELLFERRLVAAEDCALWARVASPRPSLILATDQEVGSLEDVPRVRRVGSYAYLPSTALSASGLLSPPAQGQLILLANYPPEDPEARQRWRDDVEHKARLWKKKARSLRKRARRERLERQEAP